MPMWGSLYLQNACSPVMEQLIFFHDHTMVVLILVTFLVGYILLGVIVVSVFNREMFEGQELESVWTVLPALFLLAIAFPSLSLLYMMDDAGDPDVTVKSTGRQWYWVYEYADLEKVDYESYMEPEGESCFRLLEVDNGLSLPVDSMVRMVVTSGDVIHSWAIPVLGVKMDGIPGRLNQVMFFISRPGVFVGQCSEVCGANHSFMPIVLSVTSKGDFFKQWL